MLAMWLSWSRRKKCFGLKECLMPCLDPGQPTVGADPDVSWFVSAGPSYPARGRVISPLFA